MDPSEHLFSSYKPITKIKTMKTIQLLVIFAMISLSAISQKSADLSFNLKENSVYRVKTTTVQNTTQSVMGNEQSVQTNTISVISLKPLKKMESEMITEVRFDTIITLISQPQMEINSSLSGDLNSEDPADIMNAIFHRMSNTAFLARMNYAGNVTGFMNLESLVSDIMQGTDSLKGQAAPFILQRLETMLNEKSLKTMIEAVTVYLPGKEVKKGEKWDINSTVSGGGMDMSLASTYELLSLNKEEAEISGETVIESLPGTMEMNGAQITPDIRGIGKTELLVDPGTGWLLSGKSKQQLKGEMNVSAGGNSFNIPIEIITDVEMNSLSIVEE
jgi:hypothetical protein